MDSSALNKAQIEMLNALSFLKTDDDIVQLKKVICDFFQKRADQAMNKLFEKGTLDIAKIQSFEDSHYRTSYK